MKGKDENGKLQLGGSPVQPNCLAECLSDNLSASLGVMSLSHFPLSHIEEDVKGKYENGK